ncbi:hypothetical protein ACFE04_028842 [Oxalis oulophora]
MLLIASPMAMAASAPTIILLSSSKPSIYSSSSSQWKWSGLRHLPTTTSSLALKLGNKKRKKTRFKGMLVHASLFGVGAPEALVIGVVSLLVFGPKGLAEVARTLGKTLRAFQPTIRELQEVSRDFKTTLEKEIGLDDDNDLVAQNTYNPNTFRSTSTPTPVATPDDFQSAADPTSAPSEPRAYTSEEYLKITEEQLKAAAALEQSQSTSKGESVSEPQAFDDLGIDRIDFGNVVSWLPSVVPGSKTTSSGESALLVVDPTPS